MSNPFLRRAERPAIGKAGRVSEARLAKRLGGQQTPASGAFDGAKGDIKISGVLLESKSTKHDSLSVRYDWLAKIEREASMQNKTPALAISFTDVTGRALLGGTWVMVPEHIFKDLVERGVL